MFFDVTRYFYLPTAHVICFNIQLIFCTFEHFFETLIFKAFTE